MSGVVLVFPLCVSSWTGTTLPLLPYPFHHTQGGLKANVSKSMTVSTIKVRAMMSFVLEDGDCKGFRNINKSVICGEHWNKIFIVKLLMF